MDSIKGEGYELEFVPVKAGPDNKSGITFKGSGAGYLKAHSIIKLMTEKTGEIMVTNGMEIVVIDTPKNKPIKIEIRKKNGVSGKVNLKIYDVNGKGGATMMVQKVSGGNFAYVRTLGLDILKCLIDGVIAGKIQDCKTHPCEKCEKRCLTLQELNLHVGHVHKTEMTINCNVCKQSFDSNIELDQHIISSHTISESPDSKKMRIDLTEQNKVNKNNKVVREMEIQVNDEDFMDIDTEEGPLYLQKRNDEKILNKQKTIEEEEEKLKLIKQIDDAEKKRKRQTSTEKRRKKKSERKTKVNEGKVTKVNKEEESEISLGYMGWQMDEDEEMPKDKKFLAVQKLFNDLRSDVKHQEEKLKELQKTYSAQKNDISKLNKEVSSLKVEYKNCVEALRKETEERTKAESTVQVLKEIIDTKAALKNEDDKNVEDMEIDDSLGVWITQQKRRPLKIKKAMSRSKKCEKCDKSFSTDSEVKIHAQEHSENMISSESCGNKLKKKQDTQMHEEEHKTDTTLYCDKCDEIFVNKEEASKHKQIDCLNSKFKCDTCDCSFDDSKKLSQHIKIHTKVQEYKCCKCEKTYTEMNKLRRHDWRSHRKIECTICGEQLESRDQIGTHRKIAHKMTQKIKCKFFPECLDGDECFFVHNEISSQEKSDIRYCTEGENCKNQSCEFPERDHKNTSNIPCRFQSKCNKPQCRFKHIVEKASFLEVSTQSFRKK